MLSRKYIGLACLLGFIAGATVSAQAAQLKTGDPFPDLSTFELEGELPELEGKVVLVDFWASWCAPCKQSFPTLSAMQERYGDQGFVLIGISVDDKASAMERFLRKTPVSFATVRDAKQKLVAACSIKAMPTSFLLDCDGTIRFIHNGFHAGETDKELEEQIKELLPCAK